MRPWSRLLGCLAVFSVAGCTAVVDGTAMMPPAETPWLGGMDVDELLLSAAELRDITGKGLDLTGVPGMDSRKTVDDELLAEGAPRECQFVFLESEIFGGDELKQFHKTSFQTPTDSALLSEAAAAYADAGTARHAFDNVVTMVSGCRAASLATLFVGQYSVEGDTLRVQTGPDCGRIYRVRSSVLIEVTYCGYSEVVPNVVTNRIATRVG